MFALLLVCLFALNRAAIKISDDEIYELTPFGYWLSDCFHSVSAGGIVENINDTHFMIDGIKKSRCHTPHNSTYIKQRIADYYKSIGKPMETGNGILYIIYFVVLCTNIYFVAICTLYCFFVNI